MEKVIREWAWRIVHEMREMFGDELSEDALANLIDALIELKRS